MINHRLLICALLASFLTGCSAAEPTASPGDESPAPTSVEAPTLPPTSPSLPAADPLEWLAEAPFEEAPLEPPDIVPAVLPRGFQHDAPDTNISNFPSGATLQITQVAFERPIDGQVNIEQAVRVLFYGYQSLEHRAEHLELMDWEDVQVEFEDLSGRWVVRCSTASTDLRMWISGPYLITVGSGLDTSERGPWVDTFAELILDRFPPQRID